MSHRPRIRVYAPWVLALVVIAGALGGAVWWRSDGPAEQRAPEPPPEWRPPEHNAWLDVPRADPREPRPVVLAWEEGRWRVPTFALYADGTWLRHPLGDSAAPPLTGRLDAERAQALATRFVELHLEEAAPWQTRTPGDVDQNVATFCARRDARWACASMEGLSRPAPPPEGRPVFVSDAGVAYQVAVEGVPPDRAGPNPEPFATASEAIGAFDVSDGRPFVARQMRVEVELVDAMDTDRPTPWPAELPALTARPTPGHSAAQRVSLVEAERIAGFLGGPARGPLSVDGRLLVVYAPEPRLPAHEEILAVRAAFDRLLGRP